MTDIWSFLVQTLSVSVVALLLLFIKGIMADKLSPRWQYIVWCLLALRIIIPVASNQNIFLPIPIWVEMLKAAVESNLSSVYSSAYSVSDNSSVIPFVTAIPRSITDWLMVIYIIGVAVTLIKYAVSYVKLRGILKKCEAVSGENVGQMNTVKLKYNIKGCKAVEVEGLSTSFVCGIIKPVLAIPKGAILDEKIVLHELLHLKYKDNLQNVFWCILRSLHWCNPLLQYAFNRIGNDIEALCDQRVLERLAGEELRDYGRILLSMANNRFARAAGTTSISNGGKNIKRRITAIVRFKKYPKGMELVSLCIILVLLTPTVFGATSDYGDEIYNPETKTELYRSMAYTRVESCGTVAGALDTFARGVIYKNGLCIAIASPAEEREKILSQMSENEDVRYSYYETIKGYELTNYSKVEELYRIVNLEKIDDDNYKAYLTFYIKQNQDEEVNILFCPVNVNYDNGWRVHMTGENIAIKGFFNNYEEYRKHNIFQTFVAETDYGQIVAEALYNVEGGLEDFIWQYEWAKTPDFDFINEPVTDINLNMNIRVVFSDFIISGKLDSEKINCEYLICGLDLVNEKGYLRDLGDSYVDYPGLHNGKDMVEMADFNEIIYPDELKGKNYMPRVNISFVNSSFDREKEFSVSLDRVENADE